MPQRPQRLRAQALHFGVPLPQQEDLEDRVRLALVQIGSLRFEQLVADLETRREIEGRGLRRRQDARAQVREDDRVQLE